VFACAGGYLYSMVLRDLRSAREVRRIMRAYEVPPEARCRKSPDFKKVR
jgi:hypothetical protein